jgi:hypothetical protein
MDTAQIGEQTESPGASPSSPTERAVTLPISGHIHVEKGAAADMLGNRDFPFPAFAVAAYLEMLKTNPIVAAPYRCAGSPPMKFMRGEPMKPATKRFAAGGRVQAANRIARYCRH